MSSAHRAQQLAKHTHNLSVTHNMSDCHAIKYELTFSKYELTLIFFPLSNFKIQKIQYKVCGLVHDEKPNGNSTQENNRQNKSSYSTVSPHFPSELLCFEVVLT